jgi:predicted enzyme related to lactoylglutathione lyase
MKQKATGIDGVFFRAKDPAKLGAWYREHLGLPVDEQWNGCQFHWREHKNPKKTGSTVWSAFKADTEYFGSRKGGQGHMINYRVADLTKMLAQLKKSGVWIDPKSNQDSEYGKFGWIKDSEGNRIELWEPPTPKPKKKRAK